MNKTAVVLAASLLAPALTAGVAAGARRAETHKLHATLTAGKEVPKQAFKNMRADGRFEATLTKRGQGGELAWRLTFRRLSGPATAAHIHVGKPRRSGPIALALCGPCETGAHGRMNVSSSLVKKILDHDTYVNVHTAKNPNGEIRGQISSSEGS